MTIYDIVKSPSGKFYVDIDKKSQDIFIHWSTIVDYLKLYYAN